MPVPWQCGHCVVEPSSTPVRRRWRDISIRPKCEMRPSWMRARSKRSASFRRRSTARLLRFSSMSMKSMTIRPARSRSLSWRAISSAASRLVLSAVSSIENSRVDLPELTSMATSASVWLMTMIAARSQRHVRAEHGVELALDAVAGEQRRRHPVYGTTFLAWLGISMRMKSLGFLVAVLARDDDLVDVLVVEVADRALDQVAFFVDEARRGRSAASDRARSPTGAADIRSRA